MVVENDKIIGWNNICEYLEISKSILDKIIKLDGGVPIRYDSKIQRVYASKNRLRKWKEKNLIEKDGLFTYKRKLSRRTIGSNKFTKDNRTKIKRILKAEIKVKTPKEIKENDTIKEYNKLFYGDILRGTNDKNIVYDIALKIKNFVDNDFLNRYATREEKMEALLAAIVIPLAFENDKNKLKVIFDNAFILAVNNFYLEYYIDELKYTNMMTHLDEIKEDD